LDHKHRNAKLIVLDFDSPKRDNFIGPSYFV